MRLIDGVVSLVIPAISAASAFGMLQLRGAEIGGTAMPAGFRGFSVPA
jgi:hypothetical protein